MASFATKLCVGSVLPALLFSSPVSAKVICLTNRDIPNGVTEIPDGFEANGVKINTHYGSKLSIAPIKPLPAIEIRGGIFSSIGLPTARYVRVKWIRPDRASGIYNLLTVDGYKQKRPYDQIFQFGFPNEFGLVSTLKLGPSRLYVEFLTNSAFLVTSVCFSNTKAELPN